MDQTHSMREVVEALRRSRMDVEKSRAVWDHIDTLLTHEASDANDALNAWDIAITAQRDTPSGESVDESLAHKSLGQGLGFMRPWRTPVVAAAGIVIFAVGLSTWHSHLVHPRQPVHSVQAGIPQGQSIPPSEVVTRDWRLVLVKSMFGNPGTYDWLLFYRGQPVPAIPYSIKWGESRVTSGGGFGEMRRGLVAGFSELTFSNGLKKSPPVKISWRGHSEILRVANAVPDLKVMDYRAYRGHDARWTASFGYEIIGGRGFQYPRAKLLLKRVGPSSKSFRYTLKADNHTIRGSFTGSESNVLRLDIPPKEAKFITGRNVTMTIRWAGGTDTLKMTKYP